MLNLTEHKILTTHQNYNAEKYFILLALKHSDVLFILLKNVKMPTIVGILTFLHRTNFMLS